LVTTLPGADARRSPGHQRIGTVTPLQALHGNTFDDRFWLE
jgi:hypothetical protein